MNKDLMNLTGLVTEASLFDEKFLDDLIRIAGNRADLFEGKTIGHALAVLKNSTQLLKHSIDSMQKEKGERGFENNSGLSAISVECGDGSIWLMNSKTVIEIVSYSTEENFIIALRRITDMSDEEAGKFVDEFDEVRIIVNRYDLDKIKGIFDDSSVTFKILYGG